MKGTQNTEIPLAFSYLTEPNRLIKSLDIFNHPYVIRGKKKDREKKDLRIVSDSLRIIETLIASNKKFAIKTSINGSTTKDLGGRDQYVFNQIHAVKKKDSVQRFDEFKRFLKTMRAKNTHVAVSLFFAIQEKVSDTTFKKLMGQYDTMKTNKGPKFANQFLATKGMEITQRSPDIKIAIKAPDIRRAAHALLKASILINAIGRKKNIGTSREAGGTEEQR